MNEMQQLLKKKQIENLFEFNRSEHEGQIEIEEKDLTIKMLQNEIHERDKQLQNCKKIINQLHSSFGLHMGKTW